jgi:integrase/recombinase XerC
MIADLVTAAPAAAFLDVNDLTRVVAAWRSSLSTQTRRAYAAAVTDFARWSLGGEVGTQLGEASARSCMAAFLASGKIAAEARVLEYLESLRARGLSSSMLSQRRAGLRSFVLHFNGVGAVPWILNAPMPPSERPRAYRDTTGPGLEHVRSLRAAAAAELGLQGARDVAMVGMLYGLELRRAELVGLDVGDYRDGRVWVKGKGHSDKGGMTVPASVRQDLDAYLAARGLPLTGPLFVSADRSGKGAAGGRLSKGGLWQVLQRLAELAGVPLARVSPHRIRHSSITDALDAGEDVRRVQKLSRHVRVDTVIVYDDARRDIAGEVAEGRARALMGEDVRTVPCPHCGCTCGGSRR